MINALRIDGADNVATALRDLPPRAPLMLGEASAETAGLVTRQAIPFGHKVALTDIAAGETVVKYGASIGLASTDIAAGEHVHVHNLRSVRGAKR